MNKIETHRKYCQRINSVVSKAEEKAKDLQRTAENFAYSERNKRDSLFLQIVKENKPTKILVDDTIAETKFGKHIHIYRLMQVAKPKVVDFPFGAIKLTDILTTNSFHETYFCFFKMAPNGKLEKRLVSEIKSLNGEDMPHMQELVERLKINPLFLLNRGSYGRGYDLTRALENFYC